MAEQQVQATTGEEDGEVSRVRRRGMRTGYTTGASATAAATAATLALRTGQPLETVTIHLPIGQNATFTLHRCEPTADGWTASTIKDAGDDPDVTNGAERSEEHTSELQSH